MRSPLRLTSRPGRSSHYFATKDDVALADFGARLADLTSQFRIMAGSPSVQARSLQLQADCEHALAASLARRRGEGPDETITASLLATSAVGAMRSSLRHWLLTGHDVPPPSLIEICFHQFARGLDENA